MNTAYKKDRDEKIANIIIGTTLRTVDIISHMPNTSKQRNIFNKKYNRRPLNKKKRGEAIVKLCMESAMSAVELYAHISQPIPSYHEGLNIHPGGPARIIGESGPEIIGL